MEDGTKGLSNVKGLVDRKSYLHYNPGIDLEEVRMKTRTTVLVGTYTMDTRRAQT